MNTVFELCDELGPCKVLHLANPAAGLKAIVVVDNIACGPAIGGTRMAPDVSVLECARLARAMTYKNAAAGLAHGGAKSVIVADPSMPVDDKERLIRAFAQAIKNVQEYIPGPDMGTDETCMAWIHDENGRSVGLPRVIGGIPLDEIGATGFGVATAAEVAQEYCDVQLRGARIAVQGFGAVGRHAARQLADRGAILVAAADSGASIVNMSGIDVDALALTKKARGSVAEHAGVDVFARDDIVGVECDIWIPAARPDVLNADNVRDLKAKLMVQGANIPATAEAERILHDRGILSVPDFIANAGGVICAAVEYHGGTQAAAFEQIEEKIRRNTAEVLKRSLETGDQPRKSAQEIAEERVRSAMDMGRWR